MSNRLGRALRGHFFACLAFAGLGVATLPAMAQLRQEGAIPDGRGGVGALATGIHHSCGLRQDGRASCWGDDFNGEARPLPGTFIELSAGFDHTCGLRGDGSVECWGQGYVRPEDVPPPPEGYPPPPPPSPIPAGNYTALASGISTTCGLRVREQPWQFPEGNVACWSAGWGSQLPAPPPGDFVAISLGDNFACGLRANGHPECWGALDTQQMPADESFIAITAGAMHACGLHADGSVRCWGDNWMGQATPPAELFTAIGAGVTHSCGLRPDGHAQCWGGNESGQGTPPPDDRFIALSVGAFHACGVRIDGTLACWGDARLYPVAGTPPPPGPMPLPWEGLFGMGQLAAGDYHHCQVTPGGRLSCFGNFVPEPAPGMHFSAASSGFDATCARNEFGMLQCFGSPMVSENLPIEPLRQFDVGYEHGCGVLALDGHAHCWGREVDGKTLVPPGLFRNLSGGLMHSCGVRADGTGACWGYDGDGQTDVPVLAPERAFLAIQAGERHSCGFDSGLHIRCWGLDAELPYDPNEPGQLPEFATFRALSVGAHHSCAIRTSGRLFCWGADWSGQLQNIPQGTFVAVSAGSSHTCAIRTDGTRECWGEPWMTPHLELDPESVPGVRPGEYLNVQFQLRSDGPLPVQASTYAIVAGTLPGSFFLDPNGVLHGSAYQPGRYPITVEGRDQNGFAARREVVVSIDDTPPLIQAQIAGTLGDNGWYISPVNLSWLVSEPESSIRYQDGCDPVQVQWDTQGMDFHCFADSVGGNTVESVTLKVDTQAPIVSVQSFTADGALATVTFEGHDSLSGLAGFECALDGGDYAACASPLVRTFAPGLHELLARAVDAAGNRSEPAYKNWVTDATPPQVSASVTGPLGANGWYVGNVQISWQVSDAESAVGGIGCNTVQLTVDTPGASFTCTATSAGGTTVRTVTVKRDATAPTLLPSVNPGTLLLNSPQQAKANGSDALSGIAGETCAPLATASVGAKSVACSVTDAAGNSASASTGYRVVYGFVGFSSPVQNPSVLNVSKAGRSVPLRWRVVDAQGAPVANLTAASVNAAAIACPVAAENRISTYGGSNGQLRNLGNSYYQLDWMAANSLRGSCRRLELDLGDGEARPAWFKFN